MKFYIHITTYFYQMKVFPKVTNTHLYNNQKKIKQDFFLKSTHHMRSHVISRAQ
jgi:hypothetical protein